MAQDIQIAGATFNAVPSIVVPVAGGGSATFVDPSPTTAAAADVASGKLFFDALGVLTQGTASGGGGGLVYETGEYKPSSDVAQPTINFSNSHSTPPFFVLIEDATGSAQTTNSSELAWAYIGWYNYSGYPLDAGGSTKQYARRQGAYRNNTSPSATGSNETSNTSTYVSSSGFMPSNGANYYWRSGRTYKWIAVWKP